MICQNKSNKTYLSNRWVLSFLQEEHRMTIRHIESVYTTYLFS